MMEGANNSEILVMKSVRQKYYIRKIAKVTVTSEVTVTLWYNKATTFANAWQGQTGEGKQSVGHPHGETASSANSASPGIVHPRPQGGRELETKRIIGDQQNNVTKKCVVETAVHHYLDLGRWRKGAE